VKVRDRECMRCGHKWTSAALDLAGERSEWCSRCGSLSIISTAPYEIGTSDDRHSMREEGDNKKGP
jgi:hypothetical protein